MVFQQVGIAQQVSLGNGRGLEFGAITDAQTVISIGISRIIGQYFTHGFGQFITFLVSLPPGFFQTWGDFITVMLEHTINQLYGRVGSNEIDVGQEILIE